MEQHTTIIAELKRQACLAIDSASRPLHELSQQIWNNPELKFEEHKSHKMVTDFLEEHGFPVERKYILETGFRCEYQGEHEDTEIPGAVPNVAVLCEYDALPDIGHACGHNIIAEVGAGAAIGIKAALDHASKSGHHVGKLTVLGTPAEEGGNGKGLMIAEGAFRTVDVAMMAHPSHLNLLDSPGDTCVQTVTVRFVGEESHAADTPWEGVNALDAAFMAYGSISVLRQQMKHGWSVHGIITKGGVAPNIIPGETEMVYFVRTPFMKELNDLKKKITACFEGAATSTGCTLELSWDKLPVYNVITNSILGEMYNENARACGVEMVHDFQGTLAGSTDMGNVSHVVPAIHPIFHLGSDNKKCHTKEFAKLAGAPESQPYAVDQAKILAMCAVDVYCQPHKVADMKAKLQQDIQAEERS